jgi:hypothetical protein
MKFILAAAALALVSLSVSAQTPREARRNARQQDRINKGVANGSMTPAEQAKANANEQKIDNAEAAAAADGTVTKKEKAKIERMQNRESRQIHRQKHN